MKIETLLPSIKKNISLSQHTTFRIGGPAKYFLEVNNREELIEAIKTAKLLKIPFFILGNGSNLLISDRGYNSLIIKIKNQKLKIKNTPSSKAKLATGQANQKSKIIEAESGVLLGEIIALAFNNNLTGLEWAVGIPGTIGGAVRGNAGGFGSSMSEIIVRVEAFDSKTGRMSQIKNKDCGFGYRESIFKNNPNLVIIKAWLSLKKGKKMAIGDEIKRCLDYRKKRQPKGFSAGSIFKNYRIKDKKEKEKLLRSFPELPKVLVKGIIPTGFLIESCGLKGRSIGQAQISEKHANFILNLGNAQAKDVKKLINLIKIKVKNQFKIKLEEEIQYLGF